VTARTEALLLDLDAEGFDRCTEDDGAIRVACSKCAALVIQGVPCHETRCPNAARGSGS
jgi:hypothetical protein